MDDPTHVSWRKSSYSGGTGNCVEVAASSADTIGVRDSKDPAGPTLAFRVEDWHHFLNNI